MEAKRVVEVAPIAEAGAISRDSWFGFVPEQVELKSAKAAQVLVREQTPEPAPLSAAPAIVEAGTSEPEPTPEPDVEPDPTWRIIHCEPQPNYPARGMIPPWAERIY